MKKNVLGVKIDDITMEEALKKVGEFLNDGKIHYIVTPNPEIIMAATKDPELMAALNGADLSIPDGIGLKFAGVKNRFAGADFMEKIISQYGVEGYTTGLLGGEVGIAKKAGECLRQRYQNISIDFSDSGGKVSESGGSENIKLPNLDLLFVGFGHGKQEKWVVRNLKSRKVKVMTVVGGSLDYLSGKTPRAPKFLRSLGLEWLFRLIVEPWRIGRQTKLIEFLYQLAKRGLAPNP